METTRVRFGSILEWVAAAALIAVALGAGSVIFREIRTVRPVMPVIAGERAVHENVDGIPPRAVSVPMLLLGEGREVRVGDRAARVAAILGSAVQVVSESLDRRGARERLTRLYADFSRQFIVVFERPDATVELSVAAIYLP